MLNNDVVSVEQPQVLSKRMALAQIFVETFGLGPEMSVLVANPELGNPFESAYAPWPIRIYVIENGVIQFISEPTDCAHDVTELRTWLELGGCPWNIDFFVVILMIKKITSTSRNK